MSLFSISAFLIFQFLSSCCCLQLQDDTVDTYYLIPIFHFIVKCTYFSARILLRAAMMNIFAVSFLSRLCNNFHDLFIEFTFFGRHFY